MLCPELLSIKGSKFSIKISPNLAEQQKLSNLKIDITRNWLQFRIPTLKKGNKTNFHQHSTVLSLDSLLSPSQEKKNFFVDKIIICDSLVQAISRECVKRGKNKKLKIIKLKFPSGSWKGFLLNVAWVNQKKSFFFPLIVFIDFLSESLSETFNDRR